MKAIMYHYVRQDDPVLPYFRYLQVDDFRKQLDYFVSEFRLPTKDEFKESLKTQIPIENGIILTFDDGLKDHYRYVLPELKKRNLWGIFYIPVLPYITGKLIDAHRIHLLIGKCGGEKIFSSVKNIVSENMLSHVHIPEFREMTYKTQNNDECVNFVKRTLNYYISYEHREKVIDELMKVYFSKEDIPTKEFYLTKNEIREMHSEGMIIGSHTVNHRVLSKLTIEEQMEEIDHSFCFLENIISSFDMKTFCYPYGGFHTFTDDTERLLRQNNCMFSFNVEARDIEEKDLVGRKQALPRYDCNMFPFGACRNVLQDV
jgi:peptidoglycan/xylan/chitin deacetylase (PgdA/CDA1 family)